MYTHKLRYDAASFISHDTLGMFARVQNTTVYFEHKFIKVHTMFQF